jgi:HlyD family secretion protein
VLRVANGEVFGRGREHQVYVLTPGGAELRSVRTGLRTEDFVEITEGLNGGDRVVLSEISSVEDLEDLEIR